MKGGDASSFRALPLDGLALIYNQAPKWKFVSLCPTFLSFHGMDALEVPSAVHASRARLLIPETPLLISGAFGGPFVVFILTPLRNALTLASQDRVSSALQIYKRIFEGRVARGWTGGIYPSIPAIPQFVTLGPLYHVYTGLVGPYPALLLTAATESAFTFGAHSRNAQLAFNESVAPNQRIKRISSVFTILGPGIIPHICRNCVGMTGIRIFSTPVRSQLDRVFPNSSDKVKRTASDFIGSLMSGILSTPFNQTFNFFATSQQVHHLSRTERLRVAKNFLKGQYFVRTADNRLRPSKLMLRDVALRSIYSMGLFGIYATLERNLVDYWYS